MGTERSAIIFVIRRGRARFRDGMRADYTRLCCGANGGVSGRY